MKFKERSLKTMRLYVSILLDFILHSELIIANYDRFKEQYKHYSRSSAALMLNLSLNFGSVDQGSSHSLALLP